MVKKYWLIMAIIILASFLRLYRISDYMEYLGDQGRDLVVVRDFLVHGNLFFIGPQTSIGNMYLGPFYYYLFVLPGLLLTWFNPTGPSIIVALLGVLTTYLIYLFSKKWFGSKVGYIGALLYTISPVVIKYSSFSWNPNVMPLFSLLFFYFCSQKKYIFASLAFIICLNSHYLALLLLPTGGIFWFYQYFKFPKIRHYLKKSLFLAVLIFLLSLTPQILFDVKHHGQNINAVTSFFTQRETTVNLKPYKAIPTIAPLFVQVSTRLLAGKNELFGLLASIVICFLLFKEILFQIKLKKFNMNFLFLLVWLLVGLIGLALYKQHIYDHYFGFIFPVTFILLAYLISKLNNLLLTLSLLVLVTFSLLENPFRYPPPSQLATDNLIIDQISESSNNQPFNLALLAKQNYDPPYRYLASIKNLPLYSLHDKITEQLFVICEPNKDITCNPINNPAWDVAAFGWAKIDKQWQTNGIFIYQLSHNLLGIPQ